MASITFVGWNEALKDLELLSVNNISNPPEANDLATAKLPVKWVDGLVMDERSQHRGALGGESEMRARGVIVTDLKAQDTQLHRWDTAVEMADELRTALKTLGEDIGYNAEWTITVDNDYMGVAFAVVAEIENRHVGA